MSKRHLETYRLKFADAVSRVTGLLAIPASDPNETRRVLGIVDEYLHEQSERLRVFADGRSVTNAEKSKIIALADAYKIVADDLRMTRCTD